jgi:hypothetical protein
MKIHLISILILIGILTICVGMAMSKYVFIGVIGILLLVFAYFCVYLIVNRNMTNKGGDKK